MLSLATILPPLGTCTALARVTVQWDGPFSIFVPPSASGCPEPLLALRSLALVGCDGAPLAPWGDGTARQCKVGP